MAATVQSDLRFMDVVRSEVTKKRGNPKVRLNVSGNSKRSKSVRIAIARIEGVNRVNTIMQSWLASKLDQLFAASSALELERGLHLSNPSRLIHDELNESKTVDIALNILLENGIKDKHNQKSWKAIREILQATANRQVDYGMQLDMKILATHAVIMKKAVHIFLRHRLEEQQHEMDKYIADWKERLCPEDKLSDVTWLQSLEEADFEKELAASDDKTVVWTLAKEIHKLAFKHRDDKKPLSEEEEKSIRSRFLMGAEKLNLDDKKQLFTIVKYGLPKVFAYSQEFVAKAEQNAESSSYCTVM